MTTLERLLEVQNAISALVTSNLKSYSIDGRSFNRNSLGELRAFERDLQLQYNRESGIRPRVASAHFGRAAE